MYLQLLEVVDGTCTFASDWPDEPTYMSGVSSNLELELLIGWDTIAHAIQKVLNVNNIDCDAQIETVEFTHEADINRSNESTSEDGLPNMARQPLFTQTIFSISKTVSIE